MISGAQAPPKYLKNSAIVVLTDPHGLGYGLRLVPF